MEGEPLRNIGTMRRIRTSLDVVRSQKPRTTSSLSRPEDEMEHLESLTDRRLEQVLAKERAKFAARDAGIEKCRAHLIRSREKLAMIINRNRALTELRRELQRARWERKGTSSPMADEPATERGLRQIEIRY
jgi:hypothetical protein